MKSEDEDWIPSEEEHERPKKRKRGRKRKHPLPVMSFKDKREVEFKIAEYNIGKLSVESKDDDDESVSSMLTRPSAPPDDDDIMPMVSVNDDEIGRVYEDSLLDTIGEEEMSRRRSPSWSPLRARSVRSDRRCRTT